MLLSARIVFFGVIGDADVIEIVQAKSEEEIRNARELFVEYARSVKEDLCFEGLEKEVRDLPGEYSPPGGRLLLARSGAKFAGCIALKGVTPAVCEMKRLYVRPEYRGRHFGRILTLCLMDEARGIGYDQMRLDTLPSMTGAIALYRSLGFETIPPYRNLPVPGALFMWVNLIQHPA